MKRTKQSQKKTKFLLILIVLTAILSITATYAWFSSQRDVEIVGMKLNVEVAESMEISLDGEKWYNSITIENMRQFYGTYGVTTTVQAKKGANANYVPTELLPVSTIGTVNSGKLQFMTGTLVNGGVTATKCSETDIVAGEVDADINIKTAREANNESHPYLVFDMYLKNLSAKAGGDDLQLNTGSKVWVSASTTGSNGTAQSQEGIGKEGVGLENCARVGFVVYHNTADVTATGADIRGLAAASGSNTDKVAIWEPNDKAHIAEVVANSSRNVENGTTMPTYGIKYSDSSVTIADVESTVDTNLQQQITMKPEYDADGVKSPTTLTTSDATAASIKLEPNKITKIRVYIWLEGQDVDCINVASTGDRLQATLRLTKPENTDGSSNSYEGTGTGS